MRALPALLLLAAPLAFAQPLQPSDAVEEALSATTDLAAASIHSGNPILANAAVRANAALAKAAEVLQASGYWRPPALMDPVTFKTFYDELRRGASGERHGNIARAGKRHLFTVEQVVSLMGLFAMASDRIEVAVGLYQRIADPENFDRVYRALAFDSDRRKLALAVALRP